MKTALLLTGGGPLVIATSHSDVTDPDLLDKLHAKGVDKFIAYELPVELVKQRYGGHFDSAMQDLHESNDLRVVDFNGERAFGLFRLRELGPRIVYERDDTEASIRSKLRDRVIDALEFEPSIDASDIGVAADNGVVTLTGHVKSYIEKVKAEQVVRHVKGVRAIAQDLEVRFPGDAKTSDDEIAQRALNIIAWDTGIPNNRIQARVEDGWVTLSGKVDWNYQRMATESAVHRLHGVRGIYNHLTVAPRVQTGDVRQRIERALGRIAEIEANAIHVAVTGNRVSLDGNVNTWGERIAAEEAAWAVPGVAEVDDRLTVTGAGW